MDNLHTLAMLLLAIIVLTWFGRSAFRRRRPTYAARETLFTPAELHFLQTLRRAIPEGLEVFGKVRVADVLKPTQGLDKKAWRSAFNRITAKHLDFVLCEPETGRLLCGIELNDRSHTRSDRRERDNFIAGACDGAGFPLLMVPAARNYDVAALSVQIQEALARKPTRLTIRPAAERVAPESDPPNCPQCGGALVRRRARRGPLMGRDFMACSRYPSCRYTSDPSCGPSP